MGVSARPVLLLLSLATANTSTVTNGAFGRRQGLKEPLRDGSDRKARAHCSGVFNRIGACSRPASEEHRLAVIVPYKAGASGSPYRQQLRTFVPHISVFLTRQQVAHEIWIVEQADDDKLFNRGWLINVGFAMANTTCDYLVMHDLDMLPMDEKLPYSWPGKSGSPLSMFNGNHPVKVSGLLRTDRSNQIHLLTAVRTYILCRLCGANLAKSGTTMLRSAAPCS